MSPVLKFIDQHRILSGWAVLIFAILATETIPDWLDARKHGKALNSLRNISESADPDSFFAKWNEPYGGPLKATNLASGRFAFRLSDQLVYQQRNIGGAKRR